MRVQLYSARLFYTSDGHTKHLPRAHACLNVPNELETWKFSVPVNVPRVCQGPGAGCCLPIRLSPSMGKFSKIWGKRMGKASGENVPVPVLLWSKCGALRETQSNGVGKYKTFPNPAHGPEPRIPVDSPFDSVAQYGFHHNEASIFGKLKTQRSALNADMARLRMMHTCDQNRTLVLY